MKNRWIGLVIGITTPPITAGLISILGLGNFLLLAATVLFGYLGYTIGRGLEN